MFGETAQHPRHNEIQAELIRMLYRQAMPSMAVNLAVSTLLITTVWDVLDHVRAGLWLAAVYLVVGLRVATILVFKRRAPADPSMRGWALLSAAGTTLLGVTWGVGVFQLVDPAEPAALILITTILTGLAAGATNALSPYLPSYYGLVVPSLGSLILHLALSDGLVAHILAALVLIALLAYAVHALNVHRLLVNSLALTFDNIALRKQAEEQSAVLEATLENMSQGISVLDKHGRPRMWNRRIFDLLPLGEKLDRERPLKDSLAGLNPPLRLDHTARQEYATTEGRAVQLASNAMPDGGSVITYTDVSDARRREAALEAARTLAEQANAAKTRFLAAASHDLRQPIHALVLFFDALAGRVHSTDTATLIEQIHHSIDAVDSMLNSLLDISKLDAGVMRPSRGPIGIRSLFSRLDAELRSLATESGNQLRFRPLDVSVDSDPTMLARILRNLISNAIRYTDHGRVLVAARRRRGRIAISVYDTGQGIPNASLSEIFIEFHQLGNPERDRRQGLGLGLAIVRKLTELLGHGLTVRSQLGRGSCFSVYLEECAPQVPSPKAEKVAIRLPGDMLFGLTVLVLDDDEAVLAAMTELLGRWNCDVTGVTTIREALAAVEGAPRPPDLVIADYRLRERESGLDAIEKINRLCAREIPALVITGDTAPERLREAQRSGYPLLHKPVRPAKLRATLNNLILGEPK